MFFKMLFFLMNQMNHLANLNLNLNWSLQKPSVPNYYLTQMSLNDSLTERVQFNLLTHKQGCLMNLLNDSLISYKKSHLFTAHNYQIFTAHILIHHSSELIVRKNKQAAQKQELAHKNVVFFLMNQMNCLANLTQKTKYSRKNSPKSLSYSKVHTFPHWQMSTKQDTAALGCCGYELAGRVSEGRCSIIQLFPLALLFSLHFSFSRSH